MSFSWDVQDIHRCQFDLHHMPVECFLRPGSQYKTGLPILLWRRQLKHNLQQEYSLILKIYVGGCVRKTSRFCGFSYDE